MPKKNRQHTVPVIINSPDDDSVQILQPVPLSEHVIQEGLLQKLLSIYPHMIPIDEIEPALGPLICLGMEIPTKSGPVDLLYVSPTGYLSLVETKLWRNPEARRMVVGQIIDYAKEIAGWSFQELDDAVRRSILPNNLSGVGIIDILKADGHDIDEVNFIDSLSRNLKRGHFLLLIAGDGIREDVESMVEYLQGTPNLHFTMALLELALFRLKPDQEWPLLVQPRVVARTAEIVRAIVDIRSPADVVVDVIFEEEDDGNAKKRRRTLTEEGFYNELSLHIDDQLVQKVVLLFEELQKLGVEPTWRASSVSYRFPDPKDTGKEFTVIVFQTDGKFYLGWLDQLELSGYDPEIGKRYLEAIGRLTGVKLKKDATLAQDVSILISRQGEFLSEVKNFVDKIKNQAIGSSDVSSLIMH